MAEEADRELKKAEPALIAAEQALKELSKDHITEVKSYKNPTQDIAMVMFAVMTLLGHDASWPVCQKVLADPEFIKHLFDFDKDNIP